MRYEASEHSYQRIDDCMTIRQTYASFEPALVALEPFSASAMWGPAASPCTLNATALWGAIHSQSGLAHETEFDNNVALLGDHQ